MASSPSRLIELSTAISKNTAILDQYLKDNDLPQPSFTTYNSIWDQPFPPAIQTACTELQNATTELSELTLGPRKLLLKAGGQSITSFEAITRLDIPHKIPVDEPGGITYEELVKRLDVPVNEDALTRVLRAAIVHRVFVEPSPGRIAHSAASTPLATDELLFDFVSSGVDVMLPRQYLGKAMLQFPAMDEANRSAASIAFTEKGEEYVTFYEYLARDPERAMKFGRAMSAFQTGEAYATRHVVEGFEWGGLEAGARMVDVGGSHGDIAMAIARQFPDLKFVVQDLPDTIASATASIQTIKDEALNITFMAHDFLTPQPPSSPPISVFLLRWVLHNWPDKYCIRILQNLKPAMAPGTRVLVMDAVMPEPGTLGNTEERELRFSDLTMLSCFNAGDREMGRYRALLEGAGLRFVGVRKPEGSKLSIMEGVWDG